MVQDDQQPVENPQTDDGRRQFLAGSAGVLGALTLGGAFGSGSALAQEGDGNGGPQGEPPEGNFENDVAILNYALTLEHLEAAFYEEALNNISQDDLFSADSQVLTLLGSAPNALQTQIYEQLTVIRDHEQTHVEALTSLIEDVGGDPVEAPEFDFGTAVEDPAEFVATAAELEDTGVGAYAGAAPFVENQGLLLPALSIHSVEGRHAAVVRPLAGESPFNAAEAPDAAPTDDTAATDDSADSAFDQALPEAEVIDRVNEYVAGEALEPSAGAGNGSGGNAPGDGNGTAGNASDGNSS